MVHQSQSEEARDVKATAPIAPKKGRNCPRNEQSNNKRDVEIPFVLPLHYFVFGKVADISIARFDSGFYEHPTDMRPE